MQNISPQQSAGNAQTLSPLSVVHVPAKFSTHCCPPLCSFIHNFGPISSFKNLLNRKNHSGFNKSSKESKRMIGLPTVRLPRNTWLLNCCVSPQSEIARVRIDRSLIGAPSDFRHVAHLGAGDLSSADDQGKALGALLRSKGDPKLALPIPPGLRTKDVPIGQNTGGGGQKGRPAIEANGQERQEAAS